VSDQEATNPVADETLVSAATGVADEANAQGDDLDLSGTGEAGTSDEDDAPQPEDDHEEIEHEGKKYKVPKDLKDAFLRQADYTQKTQSVAEQRRAVEQAQAAWDQQRTQQAQILTEMREDVGRVHMLETEVKRFEKVDWRAAQQQIASLAADPQAQWQAQQQYNQAWAEFTAVERELGQAKSQLNEKQQRLTQEQTQRVQAQAREAAQVLQRDIPGFNPTVASQIVDHGMKAFGLTPEEARELTDPRIWKLLHADKSKSDEIATLKAENAKLKGQRSAVASNAAAQQVTPAVKTKGASPPPVGLDDRLSTAEWMKRREAQVAKRRA
jgi:hypothetical protein